MDKKTNIMVDLKDKSISLRDLTDQWNLPSGYNRKVQGFNKVAQYIEDNRSELEKLGMYYVIQKLDEVKDLGFRTYCAMD